MPIQRTSRGKCEQMILHPAVISQVVHSIINYSNSTIMKIYYITEVHVLKFTQRRFVKGLQTRVLLALSKLLIEPPENRARTDSIATKINTSEVPVNLSGLCPSTPLLAGLPSSRIVTSYKAAETVEN